MIQGTLRLTSAKSLITCLWPILLSDRSECDEVQQVHQVKWVGRIASQVFASERKDVQLFTNLHSWSPPELIDVGQSLCWVQLFDPKCTIALLIGNTLVTLVTLKSKDLFGFVTCNYGCWTIVKGEISLCQVCPQNINLQMTRLWWSIDSDLMNVPFFFAIKKLDFFSLDLYKDSGQPPG